MLEVNGVTGGYAQLPVLKDVSFTVGDGELVGLIGLNGAGKSTTIKEIMGLLRPYQGEILVDGLRLEEDPSGYRKRIGFIPETPSLYEELTLREHVEVVAMAYDLDLDQAMERAQDLLKVFRLEEKLDWFPSRFSKGMKQKVMIVCALLIEPALLIVDEPFLGLDPLAIQDLLDLLAQEKAKGTSILMSTHVLDSAEKICDRLVVLHQGQIRADGDLASLRESFGQPNASLQDIYLSLTQEGAGV